MSSYDGCRLGCRLGCRFRDLIYKKKTTERS